MWIAQDKLNRVVIPWLILPLISCLIFFCCRSVTYFSWLKSKQKVPALAKTVILRFAHKSQATFFGHAKFASNNFSFKHRGQKNSLFTHKQQHVMHRSNSICPISAVWTVVCCVFDSAGVFWNYLCCSLYNKDYTNLYSFVQELFGCFVCIYHKPLRGIPRRGWFVAYNDGKSI